MELLTDFIEKRKLNPDEEPSKDLLFDLPCKYEATKHYGTTLLKIHGKYSENIQKLFCIRTFAIEHSFIYAKSLVDSNVVEPTASFPSNFMRIQSLRGISEDTATKLEKYRLSWEIADVIPSHTDPFPRSTSKHIRSDSTISYAILASKIINTKDIPVETKEVITNELLTMVSRCNLINLSFKIQNTKQDLKILSDLLLSVAASVHGSSQPS